MIATFGCAACRATKSPITALVHGSRMPPSCKSARSIDWRGCAQLRQEAQPAVPNLALHRGNRKLRTNLGISFVTAFTTVTFNSLANPPHLHTLKALGVTHRQQQARLTAAKKARLQERVSHTLLAPQAEVRRGKETPPPPPGTQHVYGPLSTIPQGPSLHLACTLSPCACIAPRF